MERLRDVGSSSGGRPEHKDSRPVDPRISLRILSTAGSGATPLRSGCGMSEAAAEDVLSTRLATSRSKDLFEDSSRCEFRSHPLRERRWRWSAMRATRHARDARARARAAEGTLKQEPNTKGVLGKKDTRSLQTASYLTPHLSKGPADRASSVGFCGDRAAGGCAQHSHLQCLDQCL